MFIVVQEVWQQVTPDCDCVRKQRTLAVTGQTTIDEVMAWAVKCDVVGRGEVVITIPDTAVFKKNGD